LVESGSPNGWSSVSERPGHTVSLKTALDLMPAPPDPGHATLGILQARSLRQDAWSRKAQAGSLTIAGSRDGCTLGARVRPRCGPKLASGPRLPASGFAACRFWLRGLRGFAASGFAASSFAASSFAALRLAALRLPALRLPALRLRGFAALRLRASSPPEGR
jgi:hypothetical protein